MTKSPRNPKEKEKIGFWLLNPASKLESFFLALFFLLLPTQFGKHFWPDFTIVTGIRIDYLSPTIYVTDILLILLFGSLSLRWVKNLKKSKHKIQNVKPSIRQAQNPEFIEGQPKSKKFFLVTGLVLIFLINIAVSSRPLLSSYGFLKFGELAFLSAYLAKTIFSRIQLQQIALLFGISGLFESILAILQYINQGSLNGFFYFLGERTFTGATPEIANVSLNGTLILRPYATFPHPNVLAGFLLIAMILIWSFLLKSNRIFIKAVAVGVLLLSSITLLLTFSRVAILLWMLLVCMLLLRMIFRKIKTTKARVGFLVAALVIVILISFFPLTHELYFRFASTSLSDESVTQRLELLTTSWQMIEQHPLIGVGLFNFIPSLAPLQKPSALGLYLQPVHNIFVLATAETGIIGLALLLWFLGTTILKIIKRKSELRWTFLILFLTIMITGLFDHYWLTLQQGQLLVAVVIGLSWAKLQKKT